MKSWIALVVFSVSTVCVGAPPRPEDFKLERIATPAQPNAIPLDEASAPAQAAAVTERWGLMHSPAIGDDRIARNVTQATITPVLPKPGKESGAAIIVAPGGGFKVLSMDHEGYAVAKRLADHGIAAFVLKYRLNPTPDDEAGVMAEMGKLFAASVAAPGKVVPAVSEPRATDDALRALKLVRSSAARWHVDPARVGMIGFSAGAMTSLQAALAPNAADRPAFVGYIYGPMFAVDVPAGAPPMFVAFALDDPLFGGAGFGLVETWQRAHRPVELHAYEQGDHGFGLGKAGTTSTLMLDEFFSWLQSRRIINAAKR
jgi:acetyl esterase/lipase